MLIRYKRTYEKIAMGLLSFVPTEKDLKNLMQTIKHYEDEDNWQLFLWKEEDIIGIIGVEIIGETAALKHVSVNPSHRQQGVARRMVRALQEMIGSKYTIVPSEQTKEFFEKCLKPITDEE
ncbi:riboflavin biosynthesis RibT protein [Pullulanibacillus pueri]|uniref:Protein RibT n=1 Tax=Pullulanibacillus pueri TaxID=1437324 RepID=A0A8J2ZUF9_9BACL|nr:GNAT family N-acetyltransferase [Pullulanibacillus pueri]MBM7681514.1 riboflavin biosynthesis RibT protein [Pullulanibacillus pueri]GGH79184.1 protein RibT [Pullulanibacillus pueri]